MKQPIKMPALSDTMDNGRLTKWLKQPGDAISKGEAIAEVETDKAIMEVEAFHDGYLAGPLADVDAEIPVGKAIGYITDNPDKPSAATTSDETTKPPEPHETKDGNVEPSEVPVGERTPGVLSLAGEDEPTRTVSAVVAASRPAGAKAIPVRSVGQPGEAAHATASAELQTALAAGPAYRIERTSGWRETTATIMSASAATPTFRVTTWLPLSALMKAAKERTLSLSVLLARACAAAIGEHPLFNAAYTPKGLARRQQVDIGIAVDSPEGLVTPVLRDVGQRPLAELVDDWQRLRDKVKTRRLDAADYRGASFYISNLGVFPGIYAFDSLVPPGASAILSIAAAHKGSALGTLACDHRVVFGGDAARFFESLAAFLSDPGPWLDEPQVPHKPSEKK